MSDLRKVLTQSDHEAWNATHYPGTRELCYKCGEPTGRHEEDNITDKEGHPYCCYCGEEINE